MDYYFRVVEAKIPAAGYKVPAVWVWLTRPLRTFVNIQKPKGYYSPLTDLGVIESRRVPYLISECPTNGLSRRVWIVQYTPWWSPYSLFFVHPDVKHRDVYRFRTVLPPHMLTRYPNSSSVLYEIFLHPFRAALNDVMRWKIWWMWRLLYSARELKHYTRGQFLTPEQLRKSLPPAGERWFAAVYGLVLELCVHGPLFILGLCMQFLATVSVPFKKLAGVVVQAIMSFSVFLFGIPVVAKIGLYPLASLKSLPQENLSSVQAIIYHDMPFFLLVCAVGLLISLIGAATIYHKPHLNGAK